MKTDEDYKVHAKALYIDLAEMQNDIIEQTGKKVNWIIAAQQVALAIIDVDDSNKILKHLVYPMQYAINEILNHQQKENRVLLKHDFNDFFVTVMEFIFLLHEAIHKKDHKKSIFLINAFMAYMKYAEKKQINGSL